MINNKSLIFISFISFFILSIISNNVVMFADVPVNWQMTVQDPATTIMNGIVNFHNFLLCIMVTIGTAVGLLLANTLIRFAEDTTKVQVPQKFAHASMLEIVWTVIPAIILLYIAGPSFSLLYALDENCSKTFVIKIIGHQWYWSYEIPHFSDTEFHNEYTSFDSYMLDVTDLYRGFRLLEVDNRLWLPTYTYISLIITSSDVIHSWAVPSFGIKIDACPGRLAHVTLYIQRTGVFFGQCSEICGTGHGFMPIAVRVVSYEDWIEWVKRKSN